MAYSFSRSFLLASLLIASAFLSCSLADLLEKICPKTQNPSLCNQVLRSDRRSAGADINGLAQIAIDQAIAQANLLENYTRVLLNLSKDPVLKRRCNVCHENFGDAVDKLNGCRSFLNSKDYMGMVNYASSASTDEAACDRQFQTPPTEPLLLQQGNKRAQDLASIVETIAELLLGP